jgi:hypothetical protein
MFAFGGSLNLGVWGHINSLLNNYLLSIIASMIHKFSIVAVPSEKDIGW